VGRNCIFQAKFAGVPFCNYIYTADENKIGIWKNTESVEELCMLQKPTGDELTSLNATKLKKRKKEFLITRLLISQLVDEQRKICYDAAGRPLFTHSDDSLSISHSKKYSCVMVHNQTPCGVDIEPIDDRVVKVADRFMSAYEQRYIRTELLAAHCTLIWCAKEAVYKWYGKGGIRFQRDIIIHPFKPEKEGAMYIEFLHNGNKRVFNAHYSVIDAHIIAWVAG